MKKIISAIISMSIIMTLFSCGSNLTEDEDLFVKYYLNNIANTIENNETVKITSISARKDELNGTLINFHYEYTTDIGYKTSRSLYIVTRDIEINASIITLNEFNEKLYKDDIEKYNGKIVKAGYVTEDYYSISNKEESNEVLHLWSKLQNDYNIKTEFDLEKINNAIHNN